MSKLFENLELKIKKSCLVEFFKSLFLKIYLLVFAVFIFIEYNNLDNYNIFEGKITAVINTTSTHIPSKGSRKVKINHDYPVFEYYRKKDTLKTQDQSLVLYSNFYVGDKIKIVENKKDKFNIRILNVFYYWIGFEKLIIILLFTGIIYGIYDLIKANFN